MQFKNWLKLVAMILLICLGIGLLTAPTLAGMGSSMFSLDQSTQDGVEITFQMTDSDLVVEKITGNFDEIYDRLSIADGGLLSKVGKPQLPTLGVILEIPEGATPTVEVIASEYHDLSGYNVYPSQQPVPEGETVPFVKDSAAYGIDSFYPAQFIQFQELGYLRTHRTGSLGVCPVLYNPVQKKLRVYTKIRVRIQYTFSLSQSRSLSIAPRSSDSTFFEPLYQDLYLNYRQPEVATPTLDFSRSIVEDPNYGCDYLIITYDSFFNTEALRKLAASKQKKGLRVNVRSLSDIGNTPDAKQITAYIKNVYQTWKLKPSYILLVGDTNLLPTHYGMWSRHSKDWIATDLHYSIMDGEFDLIPDIMVGRLPVRTESELNNIIFKILDYEANYNPNDFWRSRCLVVSADGDPRLNFTKTAQNIKNMLIKEGYNCNSISFNKEDPQKTSELIKAFNDQTFLINFYTHGLPFGWSSGNGPIFDYTDINRVTSKTALVFSFSCDTGMFDQEFTCIGEDFLLDKNGVVGFFGSSRKALYGALTEDWGPTENLGRTINLYIERSAKHLSLGEVILYGKILFFIETTLFHLNEQPLSNTHLELYNLLGDPELTIVQQQSNVPSFSITAPASGASLSKGSTYEIQWNWNTSISQVNLKLYKNGTKIRDIATVPCNGRYFWTVPLNLPDGNDYYISIEDSSSFISNTSKQFTIVTPEIITKKSEIDPKGFTIGDVNNDGFQDLVINDYSGQSTKLLLWNKNSGNWNIEHSLQVGINPNKIQVADANNDGYPDIITNGDNSVSILLWNQNTGSWDTRVLDISNVAAFFIGDANNDGLNDLITVARDHLLYDPNITGPGKLIIYSWDNLVKDWESPLVQTLDYVPTILCVGDADNDGYQDIVMAAVNGTLTVLPWDQLTGAWKETIIKQVGRKPYNIMIKDANNDGQNDIITGCNGNDSGVYMLLWDRNLADWNPKTITLGAYLDGYSIGDVNNDGYNDLIACNSTNKIVNEYLWNQSSGDWMNSKTINLNNNPITINIADINRDGFNDIITGNNPEKSFSVILWKEPSTAGVTLPDNNNCWKTRGIYQIFWESTNVWPGVVIELWKGNVKTREITTSNIPCKSCSYYWQVPVEVTEGKDYRIKVVNPENPSEYGYSYIFEIAKAAALGTAFQIKSPVANTQFLGGAICDITWETLSPVSKVKIDLWKGEQLYREICTVLNTNHYQWSIPEYLAKGDDYRIKISDADDLEQLVFSERFTITPPSFTVTFTAAGSNFYMDNTHQITWQIRGFQQCNTVSIELWRWGQRIRAIATIPNTGKYNWTVPKDLEGEGYSIKVYDTYRYDLEVCGYSETFSILNPFNITLTQYPQLVGIHPQELICWRYKGIIVNTVAVELWEAPNFSAEDIQLWNGKIQAGQKVDFNAIKKTTTLSLVRPIATVQCPTTRTMGADDGYWWQVPQDLLNKPNCFIKITKQDDQSVYGLSPIFPIRFYHQLQVTSPAASELYQNGPNNRFEIKWQWSGGGIVPKVNLELWNETEKIRSIAMNETNDGDYVWSIPESVPGNPKYRIKVVEPNDPYSYGFSDYFQIRQPSLLGLLGDVNGDGSVTIVDAQLAAQYVAGLNPPNFNQSLADVNRDGKIDIFDGLIIARFAAGLITEF